MKYTQYISDTISLLLRCVGTLQKPPSWVCKTESWAGHMPCWCCMCRRIWGWIKQTPSYRSGLVLAWDWSLSSKHSPSKLSELGGRPRHRQESWTLENGDYARRRSLKLPSRKRQKILLHLGAFVNMKSTKNEAQTQGTWRLCNEPPQNGICAAGCRWIKLTKHSALLGCFVVKLGILSVSGGTITHLKQLQLLLDIGSVKRYSYLTWSDRTRCSRVNWCHLLPPGAQRYRISLRGMRCHPDVHEKREMPWNQRECPGLGLSLSAPPLWKRPVMSAVEQRLEVEQTKFDSSSPLCPCATEWWLLRNPWL